MVPRFKMASPQDMDLGNENTFKRNVDELSSDSADSAPQSPVFKRPCKVQESIHPKSERVPFT